MTVRRVRVGDILRLERRSVDVDPLGTYEEIGVRSFGRGIFHKESISGADLGKKRVFEIKPGDLVFSNVFAWEGAVALAGAAEKGRIGSHRFMTYVAASDDVDLSYLRYFFLSESGLALLNRASPGSAGRNKTLAIDRFEALEISIPEVDEQSRIAAGLSAVLARVQAITDRATRTTSARGMLIDSAIDRLLDRGRANGWPIRRLGDVAEINPPPIWLGPDGLVSFVAMSAVDEVSGTILWPENRNVADVSTGYKQFRTGDVIFARITPCMQNGKSAVVEGMATEYAVGSSEFHVIRPGPDVDSRWLHRIVRSRRFRSAAAERFTGTAGQQRVPASFLASSEVPIPATLEVQRSAIEAIDSILRTGNEIRDRQNAQHERMRALTPSLLSRAFVRLR